MDLTKELEIAKKISVVAGQEIMKIYNTCFDELTQFKSDNSPLTIADRKSSDIIIAELKYKFPKISILSEESTGDKSRFENDLCWIIDPLDGTKEFINRNGEFTVNIGLAYKHKVVLGVIYIPLTKQLFFASKDKGAYLEDKGRVERIHVTNKTSGLIMVGSKSHGSPKLDALIEEKKRTNKQFFLCRKFIKRCYGCTRKS